MSLIAAAKAAAQEQSALHAADMQGRLGLRLSAVLGAEYAEKAEYRWAPDAANLALVVAVIEGLWFTEFSSELLLYAPFNPEADFKLGPNDCHIIRSLTDLAPHIENATRAAVFPRMAVHFHHPLPAWTAPTASPVHLRDAEEA